MLKKILLISLLACSLQGCLFIAGAAVGAGVFGAVVYDKRTAQETQQDKDITKQIEESLNKVPEIKENSHIVISSFNQYVLLAGQVPNQAMKDEAFSIAQTVPGIKKLFNEIKVQGNSSTMSNLSDALITSKVKTGLVAEKNLESSEIQVVTVNGDVYLMGVVTKEQADIAVDITQHVSGVHKVVKVFEYREANSEWS